MKALALASTVQYSGVHLGASWCGRAVAERDHFAHFLREVVGPRISDTESGFEAELRGLATTDMATDQVERLLRAVPEPEGWEIGEALAECALESDSGREVHWPWNTVRDRRTPRASLPGTDLVGFYSFEETTWLVFGEVKTSSELSAPPKVMNGGSGMAWQLEQSARRLDVQLTLLKWLYTRCSGERHRLMYRDAVRRFLESQGTELIILGVLIRDTAPNEADLQARAKVLAQNLHERTRIELFAWYLPIPIADWPALLREAAS